MSAAVGRSREWRPVGCSNYATYGYPLEAGVGALFDNEIQYLENEKAEAEAASNHLRHRLAGDMCHQTVPISSFPSLMSHGRFPVC